MSHDEIFKEHYFYELGRRESLNNSLSFPVGLITLIASVLFVLSEKIAAPLGTAEIVLAGFLSLCAGCLIFATFFLIKAYWGYSYKYMPFASALLEHKTNLLRFYETEDMKGPLAEARACAEFSKDLDIRYAEDSRTNSRNNDNKSSQIFKANSFIVSAIALGICAVPAYVVLSYNTPEMPYRVEISNLKDIAMPNENQPAQPKPNPPVQAPAPAPQQRPSMPPSRDIREHVDPPKVR